MVVVFKQSSTKKTFHNFLCVPRCLQREYMKTAHTYVARVVLSSEFKLSCLADYWWRTDRKKALVSNLDSL